MIRPLKIASALALLSAAGMMALPAQDACSHPFTAQQLATLTPTQRAFQQYADTLTQQYIKVVFGEAPYPPCLFQSVRDYFFDGTSPATRERSKVRRAQAAQLMRLVMNAR